MDIVTWSILGLIAGGVANFIDPRPSRGGILGSIVLGVLGALVGGFLANLVFGVSVTGFNLTSVAIAVAGSLLLLMIGRSWGRGAY